MAFRRGRARASAPRDRTRQRWCKPLRAGFIGLLLAGLCCSTSLVSAQATPGAGDAVPKSTLTFSNLVHRPAHGGDVAFANEELRLVLLETLRNEGYAARGGESLVFQRDESGSADFALGGTVEEARCAREAGVPDCCRLGIRWELLDMRRNEVVYRHLSRYGECHLGALDRKLSYRRLVIGTLRKLLHSEAFVAQMGAGAKRADPIYAPAQFARCERRDVRVDKDSDPTLDATLIVRSGNGHGSGFILSADGLVLTAAHVLVGSDVQVESRDGVSYRAHPIRVSHKFDAALLRVELPAAWPSKKCLPLAYETKPGQPVYAVGAPASQDLGFSLTRGIVSGLREKDGVRRLQTDAPVSPGNSGGPLVDARGRALAVVVSKLAGGAIEGIAFGTPIQVVLGALGLGVADKGDPSLLQAPAVAVKAGASVEEDEDDPVPELRRDQGRAMGGAHPGAELKQQRDKKTKRPLVQGTFDLGGLQMVMVGAPTHPTASDQVSVRLHDPYGDALALPNCADLDLEINGRAYAPLKRAVRHKRSGPLGKQQKLQLLESRYPLSTIARVREHAPTVVVSGCGRRWTLAASQVMQMVKWVDAFERLTENQ